MNLKQQYVVFLKKGPAWTGEDSPRLEALQQAHLAHLDGLRKQGIMAVSGPVEAEADSPLRGICLFRYEAVESLPALRALVEQDPMIQVNHLAAEYLIWYTPVENTL
jgi:uncharacterized protein YciI